MSQTVYKVQHRYDTTANWSSVNPVLLAGELGIERQSGGTVAWKIGDGSTAWNTLAYSSGPAGPAGPAGPSGSGGAPRPIDGGSDFGGTGIGAWRGLEQNATGTFLPTGGTWAFFFIAFRFDGSGNLTATSYSRGVGVLAGGTRISDANSNSFPSGVLGLGFCWRVA